MDFIILPQRAPAEVNDIIAGALEGLRRDHALNLAQGIYSGFPGRDLSFEEFLVMLMLEKDLQNRLIRRR